MHSGLSYWILITLWQRWLRKRRFVGAKRSEERAAVLLEQKRDSVLYVVKALHSSFVRCYINGKAHTTLFGAGLSSPKRLAHICW